jgi:hypothetical protein
MSKTVIAGVIINVIMIVIIILIAIYGILFPMTELEQCETKQSRFCYSIQCPSDVVNPAYNDPQQNSQPPCYGYAKMPSGDGNWYCSSAPFTKIDNNGNIL